MKTYTEPPLTIADLDATPDDGNRYELIDGELHVSSAPGILHQQLLGRIYIAVWQYLSVHRIGEILLGVGVVFDDFNGVIPDLVFVSHARRGLIEAEGRLKAAPEIAIEILSPGASNERRDRHVKRDLYGKRGVHEYWIIDPRERTIEVHRKRKEGGLEFIANLQSGDDLTSVVLPGFKLSVESLFD